MRNLLSADIGTTAVKVSLIDEEGRLLSAATEGYPLTADGPRVEQEPDHWWAAFVRGVKSVTASAARRPEALILSGQMQDLVPVYPDGSAGTAILYSDTRAREEYEELLRNQGEMELLELTANLPSPAGLPAKLLWFERNPCEKGRPEKILLGAHDYICWKLTGEAVTDYTTASTTGLMDFKTNRWSPRILSCLEYTGALLPELSGACEVTGTVSAAAAAATGLHEGLPVIHGAGDAGASTVGSGAGTGELVSCYLGTSGWMACTGKSKGNPKAGVFNLRHPDPELVLNIGPMVTAGGNVEWAVTNLLKSGADGITASDFTDFTEAAAGAAPGAGGIFYLPYLTGERSPFLDPDARGAFIGLSKESGKPEFCRAVLEGISYSLSLILDRMNSGSGEDILLSGGGAENHLWAEILASMTGRRVLIPENTGETGLIGNLIIAGKTLGWRSDFELPEGLKRAKAVYEPNPEWRSVYSGGRPIFEKLYTSLKGSFGEIAAWHNNEKMPSA